MALEFEHGLRQLPDRRPRVRRRHFVHAENRHARDGMTEEEFVSLRTARDRTLAPPKLFEPALRFNPESFATEAQRA